MIHERSWSRGVDQVRWQSLANRSPRRCISNGEELPAKTLHDSVPSSLAELGEPSYCSQELLLLAKSLAPKVLLLLLERLLVALRLGLTLHP